MKESDFELSANLSKSRKWRSLKIKSKSENVRGFQKDASRKKKRSASSIMLSIFTEVVYLTVPAVTATLGTLALDRKKKLDDEISDLKSRLSSSPIPLPDNLEDLSDMEYSRVKVTGEFDHTMERFIYPRPNFQSGEDGMLVVTPFKLKDRDERILINRGWIPKRKMDPSERAEGQVMDEVEFVGVVRHSEVNESDFVPDQGQRDFKVVTLRDVEALAENLKTSPVYLDADVKSTVKGGPIAGQTTVAISNKHNLSVMAWYSVCILSLISYSGRFI